MQSGKGAFSRSKGYFWLASRYDIAAADGVKQVEVRNFDLQAIGGGAVPSSQWPR